jgi:hypothetical protein
MMVIQRNFERGDLVYITDGLFRGEYGKIIDILYPNHFYRLTTDSGEIACLGANELVKPYKRIGTMKTIEVQQLGLATGQIVPIRRIKRIKIEVIYIP